MRLAWSALSKNAKRRIVFYGTLVFLVSSFAYWTMGMPGRSYHGALQPLRDDEREVSLRLRRDVEALASSIGARNTTRADALEEARRMVERTFSEAGHVPKALPFRVDDREVANIEVTIEGKSRRDEIVVVGAHYDTAFDAP